MATRPASGDRRDATRDPRLTVLFNVLPKVDPRRENYAKFLDSYWLIANAILVFTGVAHALIIANGLGYTVQVDRLLPVGVGLLLAFLGNYLTRVEPNWFIGVRTPWTLSSDAVWRKVHRTAGWLFVIAGWSSRRRVRAAQRLCATLRRGDRRGCGDSGGAVVRAVAARAEMMRQSTARSSAPFR